MQNTQLIKFDTENLIRKTGRKMFDVFFQQL